VREASLRQAAAELRYLLERGYPLEASLSLVGNRHDLARPERDVLRRGVVAPALAQARRSKLLSSSQIAGQSLAVDGHNQLITLESAIRGKPVVAAGDGFVRDVSRAARTYRPSPVSRQAMAMLLALIGRAQPRSVLFLFDAPVSGSGELAALVRRALSEASLAGEARAAPYPEAELVGHRGPVATADGGLIGRCAAVVDLAGEIIRANFSHLLLNLEAAP